MQKYNIFFDYSFFSCNFVRMKLSIVIPVYNVETTLDRCVKSVVEQTFADIEVILVDDGSPDHCPQLCDEWARRDPRISVIHKENGGLSDARNAGIDMAQGEYVTFVDSDDYLEADTYHHAMAAAAGHDILEFPLWRFHGSRRQQYVGFTDTTYDDMQQYWLEGHAYEHCYAWNKVYLRSLFSDVRFPKGRVFEDVATLPQLLKEARRVRTIDKGCYYYCANDNGITATATGRELQQLLEAHLQVLPQWCDDRYYMHVLNIQMDVCRLTGQQPRLPRRRVSPCTQGLTMKQRAKALIINTLGTKALCH